MSGSPGSNWVYPVPETGGLPSSSNPVKLLPPAPEDVLRDQGRACPHDNPDGQHDDAADYQVKQLRVMYGIHFVFLFFSRPVELRELESRTSCMPCTRYYQLSYSPVDRT